MTPEQEYELFIPNGCAFQTYEEHVDFLLCYKHLWFPWQGCGDCDFNKHWKEKDHEKEYEEE